MNEQEQMAARLQMQREAETHNAKLLPKGPGTRTEWQDKAAAALMLLAQRKRGEATELIAQHIQREHHIYTTRDDEKPEMWIYERGIYVPEGRTYVTEVCRELLGEAFTSTLYNDVVRKVEADTYIDQDEFFRKQEEYPYLLPVENGILDLQTHNIHPFTPDKHFFNKLPVAYNPEKNCPKIHEFLKGVLPREEDLRVLQEFFGFSLLREYKYEKSLMLLGTGRNGKGKVLDLLRRFIGPENCASISLEDMEKDQFALGELHNKLVNISGDISNAAIQHSGNFKMLTGRDIVQAARKFKTRVQFVNYAKMIFAANELPRTRDMTNAFFDRWILLEFPFRFLPQKEMDALKSSDKEFVKLQNPAIIDEITCEDEMSGLLNWSLEGLNRLREMRDFSYSPTSQKVRELWIRKSDSFMAFCLDHVEENWDGEVSKGELRKLYAEYCRRNKLKGVSDKVIKHVLEEQFGVSDERSSGVDRDRVWVGIQLKYINKIETIKNSVQGVQEVHGFSSNLGDGNFLLRSNTLDNLDTLDKSKELQIILEPCKHGFYDDEDCLFCRREKEDQDSR